MSPPSYNRLNKNKSSKNLGCNSDPASVLATGNRGVSEVHRLIE